VLVVDTQTGATWTEEDVPDGTLTFDWDDPSSPLNAAQVTGHDLRIYYRTLDRNNIELMKAPRFFVEDLVAATYYADSSGDAVDYREYSATVTTVTPPPPDPAVDYTTLTFPASMAGRAVSVDYVCGTPGSARRICNEFHVVDATALTHHGVVLSEPDVQTIVAVQGLSLTARGWWENQRGQIRKLDIDTFLTPKSLLGH